MNKSKTKIYDLLDRTAKFGEDVIEFAKKIPKNPITLPLITQLIKSATSVGANYCEADCAESRKDFIHKVAISKKEAKETQHWLKMISKATLELKEAALKLLDEAIQLQFIFIAIIKKSEARISFSTSEIRN